MKQNKYNILLKDTFLFAISNFGSKVLLFLLTPLYTNILSTTEYGIVDFISTTINFVYPILTLAISDATLRYALDKYSSKQSVLLNSLIFTFLSVIILILMTPFIIRTDNDVKEYWFFFIIIYALFSIHNCLSNFIKGIGKTFLFALQGFVQTITLVVSNLIFLLIIRNGIYGYLYSLIICHIFPILVIIIGSKIHQYIKNPKLDMYLMKDMLKYSIPMIPTILAWSINTSIDKYMIIGFVGISASAVYGVAHKIPSLITSILTIFSNAWQLSAISNHGNSDESHFYSKVYCYLDRFSVFGCLFVIACSKIFAIILFANDYFVAWQYVPMLTISAMFSSHSGFLAAAFRAEKKTRSLFISVAVGSILNTLINFFLIKTIGTLGAAFATAISFFFVWLIRFKMVQKIVTIVINFRLTIVNYLLLFLSSMIMTFSSDYGVISCIISILIIIILNRNEFFGLYKFMISYIIKKK